MKAYSTEGYRLTILSILLVFLVSGCSLTRRLKDNQALVRKITIKGVDKEFSEAAINYVDKDQQPNNKFNLRLYYWFSKNGKKDIGEPPNIVDTSLVEFSKQQIQKFLRNKGYLKAAVTDTIKVKNKRAELIFTATEGPMFRFRKYSDSIADKKVEHLYRQYLSSFTHVRPGGRYDADTLAYERDGIYTLMKRNGYYDFLRQYITFDADTTFNKSVADVKMIIDNPQGKSTHPTYKINNTTITISNTSGRNTGPADTLKVDSQYKFIDYSHKFNPRIITIYDFQKKGELYNIDRQILTTSRLAELNVFRNVPNPAYEKLADSTNRLNKRIDLVPLKQMSDRVEGEFLFNGGRYGFNIGNTFTDRNLFKSATILQVKLNYNTLFDNGSNSTVRGAVENQEFKLGASVTYPQILFPFHLPILGKYGVPHTTFASSYSLFFQKGLVERQSFVNSISYDFTETASKIHTVTPIDIEFSRGTINEQARDSLLNKGYYSYVYLIGRTIFTSGSQYTYQLNANKLNSYQNFIYFRGSLDIGGNTLSLLSNVFNTPRDTAGQRTFFGYTFAQYSKAEVDVRFYKDLGHEQQFILRLNPGIGVPYGNSSQLVFEKNFYVGGANDIRAWIPRTLGPGQFNRASYGSDAAANELRSRLRYLDQFGEIKFVANAEYRYKIANNFFGSALKGAFFVDAGNVWRLHKQDQFPNQEFRLDNILPSTAMAVGTGLRFDLTFFVFRLDAAFKFKDPEFSGSDQWVLLKHGDELFHSGTFKNTYRQTNGDSYNFMQLNFGVGMPF
ncbi:BamA/TamA family outer membrane protein [Mucilaginibacter sp.]|uniref:translocation and assembly module lipoprotein TamL n=1 Tax=Mucilaginibacter sp. TaxID=1882438 RepID=UPI002B99DBD2|nr:BamA/TamA family outer membrane protein [Mucilaginibacter sp.]HTI57912.1 BamA/TamA family outer membrane protein [Mucilaginibacter sp.]